MVKRRKIPRLKDKRFPFGKFLLLFSILFNVSSGCWASDVSDNRLTVVSFPFPPLLHASSTGEFSGTMGETVKLICERAKIKCFFKVVPLTRAHQEVINGVSDALITIKLDKFKDCCLSSQWEAPWSAGFFAKKNVKSIPHTPKEILGSSLIIVNGMRSPYLFMPQLETWSEQNKIHLFKAPNIANATKMFILNRAPLLWGSDDFNWYFSKFGVTEKQTFVPLLTRSVVLWVNKRKMPLLKRFDQAFHEIQQESLLTPQGILIDRLMVERYKDSPFNY